MTRSEVCPLAAVEFPKSTAYTSRAILATSRLGPEVKRRAASEPASEAFAGNAENEREMYVLCLAVSTQTVRSVFAI